MSDRVRKVDYFYVMVPNTAGQAAKVLAALAEKKGGGAEAPVAEAAAA